MDREILMKAKRLESEIIECESMCSIMKSENFVGMNYFVYSKGGGNKYEVKDYVIPVLIEAVEDYIKRLNRELDEL